MNYGWRFCVDDGNTADARGADLMTTEHRRSPAPDYSHGVIGVVVGRGPSGCLGGA